MQKKEGMKLNCWKQMSYLCKSMPLLSMMMTQKKNDTAATVEEVNSHYRTSNVYFMHEKKNLPEHLNS